MTSDWFERLLLCVSSASIPGPFIADRPNCTDWSCGSSYLEGNGLGRAGEIGEKWIKLLLRPRIWIYYIYGHVEYVYTHMHVIHRKTCAIILDMHVKCINADHSFLPTLTPQLHGPWRNAPWRRNSFFAESNFEDVPQCPNSCDKHLKQTNLAGDWRCQISAEILEGSSVWHHEKPIEWSIWGHEADPTSVKTLQETSGAHGVLMNEQDV